MKGLGLERLPDGRRPARGRARSRTPGRRAHPMRADASTRDNWTEPGTFEIAPGLYRIPLPLPNDALRAVNVYALAHGGDLMLIDSGWAIADARGVLDQG